MVHPADTTDLSIADGQGFRPRMRRVIRVNVAMIVKGRRGSLLSDARFRVECYNDGDDGKG
jgi:hypothetical protein